MSKNSEILKKLYEIIALQSEQKEVIIKCIYLLNEAGKNTKAQVREMLKTLIDF